MDMQSMSPTTMPGRRGVLHGLVSGEGDRIKDLEREVKRLKGIVAEEAKLRRPLLPERSMGVVDLTGSPEEGFDCEQPRTPPLQRTTL